MCLIFAVLLGHFSIRLEEVTFITFIDFLTRAPGPVFTIQIGLQMKMGLKATDKLNTGF